MTQNKTDTFVSVIIPYYNDGLYIDEAVDSILKQTHQHIEIIIVNDGSTDEFSIHQINNYTKPKTTVIHQENKGGAAARNTGFQNANADFVLTLDGDDMFESTFIEKAIKILSENQNVAAVSAWAKGFGERTFLWKLTGGTVENFVSNNQCVACALIRKTVWQEVKGYNEKLRNQYEDWDFWLRITQLGYIVHVINEPLFLYRQKSNSMRISTYASHRDALIQIISFNKAIFEKYLPDVFFVKDTIIANLHQDIANLNSQIESLKETKDYRLGNYLLHPIRKMKKLIYIIKQYFSKS